MKNFIQDGKRINLTAPSGGVVAGLLYIIGSLIVISQDTVSEGKTFVGYTEGVFELPKATGAVTEGVKLYWDSTNSVLTTTASGNTFAGYATESSASAGTTARILLDH